MTVWSQRVVYPLPCLSLLLLEAAMQGALRLVPHDLLSAEQGWPSLSCSGSAVLRAWSRVRRPWKCPNSTSLCKAG